MDRILLIDKPAGMTSHDVVDHVRKVFSTRRVGHAGTLDPFATGLLIVGVGDATKRLQTYVGMDKTYEATARLGATSDTFDPEGELVPSPQFRVLSSGSSVPDRNAIEFVFDQFRGGYEQKAPLHSAKKVGGKKLYDLARSGKADEGMRPTKKVDISELVLTDYAWPDLSFSVRCSSGTYIRSLADDIGRALGCGAYLVALRRTAIGPNRIEDASPLERIE